MKVHKVLVLKALCDRCEVTESAAFHLDDPKALANFRAHLVEIGWLLQGEVGLCVECHAEAKRRAQEVA